MTEVTFKVDVPDDEVATVRNELHGLARDCGLLEYSISTPSMTEEVYPGLDEEWDDETDPCIILPGQVIELSNGLVCQVFSIDVNGRIVLDQLEELTDSFLSH